MFKNFFIILTIIFACGMFFSCGNNGKEARMHEDGIEIDSIVTDTIVSLGKETGAPTCELSLNIQYLKKGKKAKEINDTLIRSGVLTPDYLSLTQEQLTVKQAVDSFSNRFLADYVSEYGKMYRKDKEHAASYNYKYIVKTSAESNRKHVITYMASIYIHGGGRHGINQTIAMNFNAENGKMLRINDIFVPGHDERLKNIIIEQLCDDRNCNGIDELRNASIFSGIDIYVPDNFIIGKNNITFIYCEDEIACHDIGEIRVTIPVSDLKNIMKKEYE